MDVIVLTTLVLVISLWCFYFFIKSVFIFFGPYNWWLNKLTPRELALLNLYTRNETKHAGRIQKSFLLHNKLLAGEVYKWYWQIGIKAYTFDEINCILYYRYRSIPPEGLSTVDVIKSDLEYIRSALTDEELEARTIRAFAYDASIISL